MLLDPGPGSSSPQGPAHQSPGKALSACNGTPSWGHAPSHRQSTQRRAWGWVSLPLSPQIDSLLDLPLCNPRIGHKATSLAQLLLFDILGASAALCPALSSTWSCAFLWPQPSLDIPSATSPYVSIWALKPSAAEQGHGVCVATLPQCLGAQSAPCT